MVKRYQRWTLDVPRTLTISAGRKRPLSSKRRTVLIACSVVARL
ncbi:hypothetical protein QYF52_25060 [Paenibacillus polymyxa]|nr:hypothetical protein [Paenibacillus polymyxa]MDN4081206.1 hypothetical protein [Paenibacillus polymyxa]MDN4106908.1 hypothetical protein [Paenibacillus polymyxa]MDN4116846.1 hypothetical protein [Paenibacillus polymyxa]